MHKNKLAALAAAGVALGAPLQAHAQAATLTIRNVMVGNSSSGQDQAWIRVDGKPAGVANECVYSEWSLFYANNDGTVSPDKVASLALTAKATDSKIFVAYVVETGPSDFWGWGITRCRILRIGLGE